jgi:serine/threonine protein kinase
VWVSAFGARVHWSESETGRKTKLVNGLVDGNHKLAAHQMVLDRPPDVSAGDNVFAADSRGEPFKLSKPRLVSHKPRTQVFFADRSIAAEKVDRVHCIVKVFSPRSKISYDKEIATYTLVSDAAPNVVPVLLWSGVWTVARYRQFIGEKLPTVLRRTENQLHIIVLSYLDGIDAFSDNETTETRQNAAKAALHALARLHSIGIVHGDISGDNVIIQRKTGPSYSATWIDFSASVTSPSKADVSYEWQKAVDYFSQLVLILNPTLTMTRQICSRR